VTFRAPFGAFYPTNAKALRATVPVLEQQTGGLWMTTFRSSSRKQRRGLAVGTFEVIARGTT